MREYLDNLAYLALIVICGIATLICAPVLILILMGLKIKLSADK